LAAYGSDDQILTAFLIDFVVWGANCGKMSSILKKNYGVTDNACWTNLLLLFPKTLPINLMN